MYNILADVKIYKINVGPDPLSGMAYSIGQRVTTGKRGSKDYAESIVTRIVRSENNFHLFGNIAYIIYAERTDNKKQFVYRYFENMPVYVTGVTPDSRMERIVDKQFISYENNSGQMSDQSG